MTELDYEAELAALIAERDGWRERAAQAEAALQRIGDGEGTEQRRPIRRQKMMEIAREALSAGDNQ